MMFEKFISYGLTSLLVLLCLFSGDSTGLCKAATPEIEASVVEPNIELRPGETGYFSVRVVVPSDHHAYLDEGDEGFFIPLEFEFTHLVKSGFRVKVDEMPEGEREEKAKATVLRGENTYRFSLEAAETSPSNKIFPINLRYQICNDISNVCYLPDTISFSLPLSLGEGDDQGSSAGKKTDQPLLTDEFITQSERNTSLEAHKTQKGEGLTGWLLGKYHVYSKNIFISFFFMVLAGILAAATPCVYPMLPITSAFLIQRGGGSREKGTGHAFFYFGGIIFVYIVMGYVAGMTGGALNVIMRSAVVNIVLALFFAILALSMLGFYDLSFGQGLQTKMDTSAKSHAGYSGTFLIGMVAGLVVSPCVGPIVFALLLQITNQIAELSSQYLVAGLSISFLQKTLISGRGGVLMGGFGIGIGLPFLLVGLFSNRMPKAGSWMVYVKYVLGLIILYFAFSYYMKGMGVSQVKSGVSYGILLGLVSIFASVYLGLFKQWGDDMTPGEKLRKALSLIVFIFGIHFFYNGLGQSGILLESNLSRVRMEQSTKEELTEIHGDLIWHRNFEYALALAKKENKPIFIDFYADWCANCVAFQKLSLRNTVLSQALKKAVLLKVYDTDKQYETFRDDPLYAELKRGLPFFVILKPDGNFFWKGTQYNAVNTMRKMIESAGSGSE
ncbi:MAG: DUF255 domain-containing protein [Candidatus Scalindua sp. AMX11]|nr:MAG: DUF255 domain-containing protein [Candidatus Scalindua sp.]NOG84462.1 DUF255 domain-containing protein [Planctomycetota bacterium]RZV80526.1 MAG: DUF255 domain-containing protein [Candidatus Scalindua sp. SCAELEC01]TDE65256.1 MAG: DUF255 domain-containing protein [Candidatus Scalindua sp. AMX11]GJQ58462.1 MAG: hypothetical protein SCALA701_12630 [Candidatus Scalindua sp.]